MSKPNGAIVYEGPSAFDGKPIVVIATGLATKSQNTKTGDMIQTYIMRSDIDPITASKLREDCSVCGDCKHRGFFGAKRTCYVNLGQAPLGIYKAYKKGNYSTISQKDWADATKNRSLRLGSYGDPSAIPGLDMKKVTDAPKNHTAYTHFWEDNPHLKEHCMASVDTEEEYNRAKKLGWRTFRVKTEDCKKLDSEVECPAVAKPGVITCATCTLCSGQSAAKDIVLNVHGAKWKIDEFKAMGK